MVPSETPVAEDMSRKAFFPLSNWNDLARFAVSVSLFVSDFLRRRCYARMVGVSMLEERAPRGSFRKDSLVVEEYLGRVCFRSSEEVAPFYSCTDCCDDSALSVLFDMSEIPQGIMVGL